ncbi:MAG: mRNA (guanine-7-)methyltransferase [Guiyang xinmovirus 1]|nr:MAG: mRNA (guanine-7-)methyltransferase [Guiyang xinmovirus 1]
MELNSKVLNISFEVQSKINSNKKRETYLSLVVSIYFEDDKPQFKSYLWRKAIPNFFDKRTMSKLTRQGLLQLPQRYPDEPNMWLKLFPNKQRLKTSVLISIPCEQRNAIIFWREMIKYITESTLPLSNELSTYKIPSLKTQLKNQFQRESIAIIQLPSTTLSLQPSSGKRAPPPIWTKFIHHLCRLFVKISSAASKILICLGLILARHDRKSRGMIISLAEGSGSILNLLMHIFPETDAIYNSLQKDTVELKLNVLNLIPPALTDDPCQLPKRLIGLKKLNLGESNIKTHEFQEKLKDLLDDTLTRGNRHITILTIDAENKDSSDNLDILCDYLPIFLTHSNDSSIFINKMFISSREQVERICGIINDLGLKCAIVKPYGSHPNNQEIYVVAYTNPHEPDISYKGFMSIILQNMVVHKNDLSCNQEFHTRLSFFNEHIQIAIKLISNYQGSKNCLWWPNSFSIYKIEEIDLRFFSTRHQMNLLMLYLSHDKNYSIYNEDDDEFLEKTFIEKERISALLISSMALSTCKNNEEIVRTLDSLSMIRVMIDSVPGKHHKFNIDYCPPNLENQSVIGVLDEQCKDLMRIISFWLEGSYDWEDVPKHGLWDEEKMEDVNVSQIWIKLGLRLKSLKLSQYNGFTLLRDNL